MLNIDDAVHATGLRCMGTPANWELVLDRTEKPTDLLVKTISPDNARINFNESKQNRSEPAPMDYSLRHFLAVMFRAKRHLKIELFKIDVERIHYEDVLSQ